jgi:hypothetical protein
LRRGVKNHVLIELICFYQLKVNLFFNIGKYAYGHFCQSLRFYHVNNLRDDMFLKIFGNHVKALRKEKNFIQEKLAFEMGVEISQISRIE